MRKLLILALSVLSLNLVAQVPQGVGYQGVATDANGIELVNQSISIRASVLSGSANGTIEWEETHAVSTDTFGLFTLTIGQGTNTTNGLQTSFADISWGTNTYFLKIEMDVTGGSTYSNMGTNQMMSVPYALYAESANINYDSISNLLSNDSTFITNVGGGMGGGGCDYNFPSGLNGQSIIHDLISSNYTVPAGKNLYITHSAFQNASVRITVNGYEIISPIEHPSHPRMSPFIANPGDVISFTSTGSPFYVHLAGYLADENYFANCGGGGGSSSTSSLDSTTIANMIANSGGNMVFGDIFSVDPSIETQATSDGFLYGKFNLTNISTIEIFCDTFSGNTSPRGYFASNPYGGNYLRDGSFNIPIKKNEYYSFNNTGNSSINDAYFVPLVSSASTSSLDSTAIANMIANTTSNNSVSDFSYPDGKEDITPITYFSGIYTPPNNKNLYITSVISNLQISSNSIFTGQGNLGTGQGNAIGHPDLPIIVSETDVVDGDFNGFLVDAIVDPITMMLTGAGTYTVPSDKILVILNVHSYYGSLKADGNTLLSGYFNYYGSISGCSPTCFPKNLKAPIFVDENTLLTAGSGNGITFNGYLMDK